MKARESSLVPLVYVLVAAQAVLLGGCLDEPTMRQLNRAVDVDKRDVKAVVREFLDRL